MNHSPDLLYQMALGFVHKIGPITAKNLIAHCGSAQAVFEESPRKLLRIPGIGSALLQELKLEKVLPAAEKELALSADKQIAVIGYLDPQYPRNLAGLPDSPIVLYYSGQEVLNHPRSISIVGTRAPSPEGLRLCETLIEGLAPYQVVVYSGLAYGIDIQSHRTCVRLGCPTVGVVAHGLSQVYPPEHASIARQMLPNGGLLSEYPFHKKAEREHFPMRNRLIAGISDALIVVETRKKGGSMITANLANTYNKEVFAFPGRPTDEKSAGCNALIKQHKAILIENAADVVKMMNWNSDVSQQLSFHEDLFHGLSDEEKNVLLLLGKKVPVSFEVIAQQLSTPQSLLSSILLELEFKGLVKSLPGNRFTRN